MADDDNMDGIGQKLRNFQNDFTHIKRRIFESLKDETNSRQSVTAASRGRGNYRLGLSRNHNKRKQSDKTQSDAKNTTTLQIRTTLPGIQADVTENDECLPEIPKRFRKIFQPDIKAFNEIQRKLIDPTLHADKSLVICAPTGSGKTVVMEFGIIRLLMCSTNVDFLCVYIAPIKSLCSEKFFDWNTRFNGFKLKILQITGDSSEEDVISINRANIIIATPEKWDIVTRRMAPNASFFARIRLVLIDEVHTIGDSERGAVLETVVTRMKLLNSGCRFIAVSATIPNTTDIARWLTGSNELDGSIHTFAESMRPVPLSKVVIGYQYNSTCSEFRFEMNLNYKLPEIISKYSHNKPCLIFCGTRKSTAQVATLLFDRAGANTPLDSQAMPMASQLKDPKLKEYIGRRIAYHHAGLETSDRRIVEDLFRRGLLSVLASTSTLSMGINLPAHLVIIKSTSFCVAGGCREYSRTELMQMMGRAGRPQFDTSATVVIMTKADHVKKYNDMVDGTESVQSRLNHKLTEYVNAEIGIKTITNIETGLQWLQASYFAIRLIVDPRSYGFSPDEVSSLEKRNELLKGMLRQTFQKLMSLHLLQFPSEDQVISTGCGLLMSKYYVDFETLRRFSPITDDMDLESLLTLLCGTSELNSSIILRFNEKKVLNGLNKNKEIRRFQVKDRIKTTEAKAFVLIQAGLSGVTISDFSLSQDAVRLIKVANRLMTAIFQYLIERCTAYRTLVSATQLTKSLKLRQWYDSDQVLKQFQGIGQAMCNAFVNAGVKCLDDICKLDPMRIEMITSRHPPFGNNLLLQANSLPRFSLAINETVPVGSNAYEIILTLINHELIGQLSRMHSLVLICGDEQVNYLLLLKTVRLHELISKPTMVIPLTVQPSLGLFSICAEIFDLDAAGVDQRVSYELRPFEPDDTNKQTTSKSDTKCIQRKADQKKKRKQKENQMEIMDETDENQSVLEEIGSDQPASVHTIDDMVVDKYISIATEELKRKRSMARKRRDQAMQKREKHSNTIDAFLSKEPQPIDYLFNQPISETRLNDISADSGFIEHFSCPHECSDEEMGRLFDIGLVSGCEQPASHNITEKCQSGINRTQISSAILNIQRHVSTDFSTFGTLESALQETNSNDTPTRIKDDRPTNHRPTPAYLDSTCNETPTTKNVAENHLNNTESTITSYSPPIKVSARQHQLITSKKSLKRVFSIHDYTNICSAGEKKHLSNENAVNQDIREIIHPKKRRLTVFTGKVISNIDCLRGASCNNDRLEAGHNGLPILGAPTTADMLKIGDVSRVKAIHRVNAGSVKPEGTMYDIATEIERQQPAEQRTPLILSEMQTLQSTKKRTPTILTLPFLNRSGGIFGNVDHNLTCINELEEDATGDTSLLVSSDPTTAYTTTLNAEVVPQCNSMIGDYSTLKTPLGSVFSSMKARCARNNETVVTATDPLALNSLTKIARYAQPTGGESNEANHKSALQWPPKTKKPIVHLLNSIKPQTLSADVISNQDDKQMKSTPGNVANTSMNLLSSLPRNMGCHPVGPPMFQPTMSSKQFAWGGSTNFTASCTVPSNARATIKSTDDNFFRIPHKTPPIIDNTFPRRTLINTGLSTFTTTNHSQTSDNQKSVLAQRILNALYGGTSPCGDDKRHLK